MSDQEPRLPPELEREILEISARAVPRVKYTLLTVSRRVYSWIYPLLYETLAFKEWGFIPSLKWLFERQRPEFLASAVRRVLFEDNYESLNILDICPAITHLAISRSEFNPVLAPKIYSLSYLRFLAIYPGALIDLDGRIDETSSGTQPAQNAATAATQATPYGALTRLTHLTLLNRFPDADRMAAFCRSLPALTHLAINLHGFPARFAKFAPLLSLTRLKLLVIHEFCDNVENSIPDTLADVPEGMRDDRVVFTTWNEFYEGLLYGEEEVFWEVAERFVCEKRMGLRDEGEFLARREAHELAEVARF
ncbi:hypothetical protein MKEN_01504400 [Mycena kentingensis (nom. inval.)]|nr:hypothetical protein MKEN_01504400 [Mycena kentingensis (nom. inval.)]